MAHMELNSKQKSVKPNKSMFQTISCVVPRWCWYTENNPVQLE